MQPPTAIGNESEYSYKPEPEVNHVYVAPRNSTEPETGNGETELDKTAIDTKEVESGVFHKGSGEAVRKDATPDETTSGDGADELHTG
ncbi:hypothetical protein GN958_ATG18658, partial [Phytophthora infestans]